MTYKAPLHAVVPMLIGLFAYGPLCSQESGSESPEEVFELSPFTVSSEADSGYYASQTLSGGRINSRLENLGTSIQVITEELLQDIGATKAEDVLLYTTNTDVGGPSGNISAPAADTSGTPDDSAIRTNPAGNNRIRAVGAADLTRNFFRTDIPFDSYNAGRLDIQRGANSFLFGLGSPAGIINYSLDRAEFKDSGRLGMWFSNEGLEDNFSTRLTLSLNRELVEDILAVRLAVLNERQEYLQDLTNKDVDRYYAAMTVRPFKGKNIYIRANVETGQLDSVPPSALGPLETLSSWLENKKGIDFGGPTGRFIGDPYTNVVINNTPYQGTDANGSIVNFPSGGTIVAARKWALVYDGTEDANGLPTRAIQNGVDGNMWRRGDPFFDPDKNFTSGLRSVFWFAYPNLHELGGEYAGYRPQGLTDYSVFDFRKTLLSGGFDRLTEDYDTHNLSLEATTKDRNFGVEISFNSETLGRNNSLPIRNPTLYLDVNRTLVTGPNSLFGETNPNFGRVFVTGSNASIFDRRVERETLRATAFARLDFREKFSERSFLAKLGNHTLTALMDSDDRLERNTEQRMYSFGNDVGWHLAQPNATQSQRQTNFTIYVTDAFPSAFVDPNFRLTDFTGIGPRSGINLNLPAGFSVPVSYYNLGEPYFKPNPTGNPFGFGSSQVGTFNPAFGNADGSIARSEVESLAFNSQSLFLEDHLVLNLGWRTDTWDERRVAAPLSADPADEQQRDFSPTVFNLFGAETNTVEEENFSYNVVVKVPSAWLPAGYGLSFHYGESSNFIPAVSAFDTDGTPVPSGSGETKDYGFTINAMDNKLVARVNWYETTVANEPYEAVNFGFRWTSTAHLTRQYLNMRSELWEVDRDGDGKYESGDDNGNGILDSLEGDGKNYLTLPQLRQLYDAYAAQMYPFLQEVNDVQFNEETGAFSQGNGAYFTLADTADVTAEGLEFEMVYNPTPQLRLGFSVVRQSASRTNLAPRFGTMFNALVDALNAIPAAKGSSTGSNKLGTALQDVVTANGTVWNQLILGQFAGQAYYLNKSLEGADNPEVRKWRVNAYGNYTFKEGRLKGANIGGAYRFVDSAAIGYGLTTQDDLVIPDVGSVFSDKSTHTFDVWAGYSFRVARGVNWRVQLNIRNLFADSDPLVVQTQPDGSAARVRYAPPRTFLLQNTISF